MIALMIAIVEPVFIWGAVVLHMAGHDWSWTIRPLLLVYLIGVASMPIAIAGLFLGAGGRQWPAYLALALGAVNFFICGIPLIQ